MDKKYWYVIAVFSDYIGEEKLIFINLNEEEKNIVENFLKIANKKINKDTSILLWNEKFEKYEDTEEETYKEAMLRNIWRNGEVTKIEWV